MEETLGIKITINKEGAEKIIKFPIYVWQFEEIKKAMEMSIPEDNYAQLKNIFANIKDATNFEHNIDFDNVLEIEFAE